MKSILPFGFLTLLTAILIAISCQKSNDDTPDNPNNPNIPVEYVTASISGRILDNSSKPVNGAVVKAGNASATTDINGNFRISNVSLDKNAGFIKVEKDGFFQGSRTIVVNSGTVNYVSIQLIKKTVSGTVSGSAGGNITVPGGGSVVFTGNSFVNTAGNSAYTGTVSVSTFFLNPTESNITEIMPGALRGINTANEETGLQSFGMMAVELNGASGEKLQLAAGKTATLTFPIPTALLDKAPATIPLWSFNDTTGLWKEEGVATRQGNSYVGSVSHFSFWNCDYPYGVVDFKAVIKDQGGNPLYPAQVSMKTTGDSITSYGSGYTDSTGLLSGKIPKGKTLELKVYNKCNTVIYTQNIGPFNATADLGTITVNTTGPTQATISGSVTNCTGSAVTNGYVGISIGGAYNNALVTNGSFSMTVTHCNSLPVTAVLTAYDLTNNQSGTATNVTISSATVNAGKLSACGNTLTEFLNYTVNGVNTSFAPPADTPYITDNGQNYFTVYAYRSNERITMQFGASGVGTVPLGSINIYRGNTRYIKQAGTNLNITEFGPVGGYISGNFSGNVKDTFANNTIVPATLSFRIKR